jgi:hypothetical protein
LDHAEEVAVWVFQRTEVIIRVIRLWMTLRSDFEQSVHLAFSVIGVEVEVQPIPTSTFLRDLVQRYVRAFSFGVMKNDLAALRWVSRDIVKCFLPERQHLVELITIYND